MHGGADAHGRRRSPDHRSAHVEPERWQNHFGYVVARFSVSNLYSKLISQQQTKKHDIFFQRPAEQSAYRERIRHQPQSLSGGLPGGAARLWRRVECGVGLQQNDGTAQGAGRRGRQGAIAEELYVQRQGDCGRDLCGDEFDPVFGGIGEYGWGLFLLC